jgi:hypothetical protein
MVSSTEQTPGAVRGKALRVLWWFIGGLIAILGIGVVILALILYNPPPPLVLTGQPQDMQRLQAELREVESKRAKATPAVLQVDEAELNSYIHSHLALNSTSTASDADNVLRDVKIKLNGDVVTLYVAYSIRGKDMTFVLEGRLHSRDGYAEFDPVSAKIGVLPIPSSRLRSAMEQMRSSARMRENLRLPGDVSEITVKDGRIVVCFK